MPEVTYDQDSVNILAIVNNFYGVHTLLLLGPIDIISFNRQYFNRIFTILSASEL